MQNQPTNLMNKDECWVDVHCGTQNVVILDDENRGVNITKSDAIAAARAILKHFNATLESDQ